MNEKRCRSGYEVIITIWRHYHFHYEGTLMTVVVVVIVLVAVAVEVARLIISITDYV